MDAKITTRKTATTGATVSVSGIIALVIATKCNTWLKSQGVDVPVEYLTVAITAAIAGALRGFTNWLKHRGKK